MSKKPSQPVVEAVSSTEAQDESAMQNETLRATNTALAESLEAELVKTRDLEAHVSRLEARIEELEASLATAAKHLAAESIRDGEIESAVASYRPAGGRRVRALVNLGLASGTLAKGTVDEVSDDDLESLTLGVHYEEG